MEKFESLKKALLALDSSHLCDASPSVQVLLPEYQILGKFDKLVGIARTVSCHGDATSVLHSIFETQPNEILVVDSHQCQQAMGGGFFAQTLKKQGANGLIVDGYFRDKVDTLKTGLPTIIRGVYPRMSGLSKLGLLQVPVSCFGATVTPGDIIYGDSDGVVVIPAAEADSIIKTALMIKEKEAKAQTKFDAGTHFRKLMNFDEHMDKLEKGLASKLAFTVDEI